MCEGIHIPRCAHKSMRTAWESVLTTMYVPEIKLRSSGMVPWWMPAVLVRVIIAMRKHHAQKQAGEERVCLVYTSTSLLILIGSPGQSLEAGADAEATKGCCLLACPQPGLMEAFSQLRVPPLKKV